MAASKPIAITAGEPAGIGPDLIIQYCQVVATQQSDLQSIPFIVIADPDLLRERAQQLQLPLQIKIWKPDCRSGYAQRSLTNCLNVYPVPLAKKCVAGQLNTANADYVLQTLKIAAQGCLEKNFSAIVTAPVHKGIINDAGFNFSGHTEFFAEYTKTQHVVMLMVAKQLRVALATTHLPLCKIADAITPELLINTLQILNNNLKNYFKINNPKILVCGLNPHAGEDGHLGNEEIKTIIPVLEQLRNAGLNLTGPVPADTAFLPQQLAQVDAVLAMYHDQGLPVLKHLGFDHAVNVTLGLPFIRTSVDHGTALSLAGTGKAEIGSLSAAIELAHKLTKKIL
jgi:4-hydroxythreonine-4-phosphate dehydrogenase